MEINIGELIKQVVGECRIDHLSDTTSVEDLEKFISKLQEKKEELERYKHRAPKGDKYYHITDVRGRYVVCEETEDYSKLDDRRYENGNYFLTKEEAEKQAKRMNLDMRARKWMRENDGDFKPDWGDDSQARYYVCCDTSNDELCTRCAYRWYSPSVRYFSSKQKAQAFIDVFGDELMEEMRG